MDLLLAGILTACGFLILLWKSGLYRIGWLEFPLDLAVSGGLTLLFWGTFAGMFTAIVAGLFFSLGYRAMRRCL